MEESLPNDTIVPVTVSEEVSHTNKNKNIGVYVLLILLIFSLVGLIYFVLKDNGINLLKNVVGDVSNTQEDITVQEDESDYVEECPTCTNELSTDNNGWALFSLPEYGFSVEVPTYRLLQSLTGAENISEDIYSYWEVRHADYEPQDFNLGWSGKIHPDLTHHVAVQFFPSRLPYGFGCGQGCVKEHKIDVYIFEKKGTDSWTSIKDSYIKAMDDACPDDGDSCTKEISDSKRLDRDILSYNVVGAGGSYRGYVLLSDSYVFNILYYIDSASSESKQIAEKVLDSMKFE